MTRRNAQGNNPAIVPLADITFEMTDTKLNVPIISLSKENDIKILEQLKLGFKRTIKWNKYRSQMTIQPQNDNLIDGKRFFDLPVKNEEEAYKKIIDMSNDNDYTDPQQISFIGKLLNRLGATVFFRFWHNHKNNGNTKNCKFSKWF